MPCNDTENEHEENLDSATATSSKIRGTSRAEAARVSHTVPCDRAGALDVLQQSSKHQAEFVLSNAVPPSRDVVAEDSGERSSPEVTPKGDAVSLENDQVKTSFKHVGLIIEVCAGSAMLSR